MIVPYREQSCSEAHLPLRRLENYTMRSLLLWLIGIPIPIIIIIWLVSGHL